MTREEAINFLKGYLDEEVYTEKCRNAHEMAIKVLEQEPCEDCISRKQAIATIGTDIQLNLEGRSGLLKYSDEIKDILKALLDKQEKILKALPPVTPTKCVASISFSKDDLRKIAEERIEVAIKQEPKAEWIPVSERLPEEGKTVIASVQGYIFPEARYTKEYGWEWAYESGTDYWEKLEDVIAWQPLPQPYERKRDNEDGNQRIEE